MSDASEVFVLVENTGGGELPQEVLGVYTERATAERVIEAIHAVDRSANSHPTELDIYPVPLFAEGDVSLRAWPSITHIAVVKRRLGDQTERSTYRSTRISVDEPDDIEETRVLRADSYILNVHATHRTEAEAREVVDREIARLLSQP